MSATETRPPQIGIDASSVVGLRTGIGHATAELLSALGDCWPGDWPPARVWVNSPRHELPSEDSWLASPAFQVRRTRLPGRALLRGWQYLHWPPAEMLLGPVDLVHAPASYIMPVRAARRVVTVHDIYFKYAPQHVEPYGGGYFAQTFERGLERVEHVIAVSEFTREELLKFYPLDPHRISVVPNAVDPRRFNPEPLAEDPAIIKGLGVAPPYLLCVATIEPRKNLITLIEAYARARQILRAGGQRLPRLVITGQPGWGIKALTARVSEALLQDMVTVTGYLEDRLLPALYRQALGFVFPSIYEGFGMPVLEAMACGCPAAVAKAASLPEIAGDAAAYFNPRDSDSMARALTRFVTDPHWRGDLREAGLRRAREFTWATTARKTLEVYRQVMQQPPRF